MYKIVVLKEISSAKKPAIGLNLNQIGMIALK